MYSNVAGANLDGGKVLPVQLVEILMPNVASSGVDADCTIHNVNTLVADANAADVDAKTCEMNANDVGANMNATGSIASLDDNAYQIIINVRVVETGMEF